MKNKIQIIISVLLLFSLSFFCWFKPAEAFSDSERRALAQMPAFNIKTLLSGTFMTDFEDYSVDQFPVRDGFRTLKAIVNKNVFLQSDNNKIYLKDGYLSQMEYPQNDKALSHAINRFNYINDKYLSNSKVYLSVIADKNYYLDDGSYLTLDYDKLIDNLKEGTPFAQYIDIKDTLTLNSFFKTDTHWRQEKTVETAERLASAMGTDISAEYVAKTLDRPFYGVYYSQSALPLSGESLTYLDNKTLENAKVFDYQNNKQISVYDMEKATGKDPYEMFLSGSLSLVTMENENAKTDKELVLFRDSFASSIAPLFLEGYSKVTLVDIRYIHPDMLEQFVTFDNADVLFLYSTIVLNNANTFK